ncbi:type II toxin-antitoxin system HipA family toxin (plasmid) [Parasedimentitalea marina]|uniref:Type II toxin-antitoxin system HipA family toxin n=1 Tax=Parasedimentitalea marina TaxID=2483033 RepID=A0A3T0NAF8_9RHOB|nr:HipA domain-containing protein [Parasedimentitalea marina]AZV80983.1 type II toxin-antitoxin system HipA family toxin [Parasedimentitalea marina]
MGRKPIRRVLCVYLNGRLAGKLTKKPDGAVSFTYSAEWLDWDHTFPVSLSLPLQMGEIRGGQVLSVFDNLLPDNDQLRRDVAQRMGAEGRDPHSLLSAIGRDCVGAMQFIPEGEAPGDPFSGESVTLEATGVEDILKNLSRKPLGLDREKAFRISVAGAQEKTALLFDEGVWKLPAGLTATTHILKTRMGLLAAGGIDMATSLENEFLCLKLARAFGFDVNDAWIERFGETDALVIERFDRQVSGERRLRLPQEDFCQALGYPSHTKYETDGGPGIGKCLELLQGAANSNGDRVTFFAAQIFFWMIGATDGHAKNFSVFLSPSGYELTPLYDILSAEPALAQKQITHRQMQLAMAVRGESRYYRIDQIVPRHFHSTAKRAGLGETLAGRAFDQIIGAGQGAIDAVRDALPVGFPEGVSKPIFAAARHRLTRLQAFHAA